MGYKTTFLITIWSNIHKWGIADVCAWRDASHFPNPLDTSALPYYIHPARYYASDASQLLMLKGKQEPLLPFPPSLQEKKTKQPKQTPPSSFLFHNNNTAANCAMLHSGWKCLPDPCVQLVSSQEHEIWLFLPLSSLVQPQVLLSLLHFSDRLFFSPWRLAWTFQSPCSEVPRRGRCAASGSGEQHQPAIGFHVASGPLDVSTGLLGRGGDPCKGVEVEELHERVVWLNIILFWLCRHPAPSYRMRRQTPEKSRSATLTRGKPALSTHGLVEY